MFIGLDSISIHKHAKKELGQYPVILTSHLANNPDTVEPRFNEPLYYEVLDITNDFLNLISSKIYGKQPRYNETSL